VVVVPVPGAAVPLVSEGWWEAPLQLAAAAGGAAASIPTRMARISRTGRFMVWPALAGADRITRIGQGRMARKSRPTV